MPEVTEAQEKKFQVVRTSTDSNNCLMHAIAIWLVVQSQYGDGQTKQYLISDQERFKPLFNKLKMQPTDLNEIDEEFTTSGFVAGEEVNSFKELAKLSPKEFQVRIGTALHNLVVEELEKTVAKENEELQSPLYLSHTDIAALKEHLWQDLLAGFNAFEQKGNSYKSEYFGGMAFVQGAYQNAANILQRSPEVVLHNWWQGGGYQTYIEALKESNMALSAVAIQVLPRILQLNYAYKDESNSSGQMVSFYDKEGKDTPFITVYYNGVDHYDAYLPEEIINDFDKNRENKLIPVPAPASVEIASNAVNDGAHSNQEENSKSTQNLDNPGSQSNSDVSTPEPQTSESSAATHLQSHIKIDFYKALTERSDELTKLENDYGKLDCTKTENQQHIELLLKFQQKIRAPQQKDKPAEIKLKVGRDGNVSMTSDNKEYTRKELFERYARVFFVGYMSMSRVDGAQRQHQHPSIHLNKIDPPGEEAKQECIQAFHDAGFHVVDFEGTPHREGAGIVVKTTKTIQDVKELCLMSENIQKIKNSDLEELLKQDASLKPQIDLLQKLHELHQPIREKLVSCKNDEQLNQLLRNDENKNLADTLQTLDRRQLNSLDELLKSRDYDAQYGPSYMSQGVQAGWNAAKDVWNTASSAFSIFASPDAQKVKEAIEKFSDAEQQEKPAQLERKSGQGQ